MSPASAQQRHPGAQLLIFLIALCVWFYISTLLATDSVRLAYKDLKGVPVNLLGEAAVLGKNFVIVHLGQPTVDLRVRGPEKELERITAFDVTAYVNIGGLKPGKTYSPVVRFVLPANIEPVGAPPAVRVDIQDSVL